MKTLILSLGLLFSSQFALAQVPGLDGDVITEIKADNAEEIQKSIDQGVDVNDKDQDGQTLLHMAASFGDINATKLLLKYDTDVNAQNNKGKTPLHLAALRNQPEVAELLIKSGADINAQDNSGQTPVHLAVFNGSLEAVKLLAESGADLNIRHYSGAMSLLLYAKVVQPNLLGILKENGAKFNTNAESMWKKLFAISDVLAELWYRAENFFDSINYFSNTPNLILKESLMKAIKIGDLEEMQDLISKIADINAPDYYGDTPLGAAVYFNQPEAVKLLLYYADINAQDENGKTPLHLAILKSPESVEILIKKGADVNIRDNNDRISLHGAAHFGQTKVVKGLINKGADVNAQDNQGETPLDKALNEVFTNLQPDTIELLKEHGALTGEELLQAASSKTSKAKKPKAKQSFCKNIFTKK